MMDPYAVLCMRLNPEDATPEEVQALAEDWNQLWEQQPVALENYKAAMEAMGKIRWFIEQKFGTIADLKSEEAVLLTGPEPIHEADAIIEALQNVWAYEETKE